MEDRASPMARAIAVFTLLQGRERDSPPRYFAFLAEANAFGSEAFLAAWIHLVVKPKAGCRCRHPFRRSKASLRFRPRLPSLSGQALRRSERPSRRKNQDRRAHQRARRRPPRRQRRQRLALGHARRQMVPPRGRRGCRCSQSPLSCSQSPLKWSAVSKNSSPINAFLPFLCTNRL